MKAPRLLIFLALATLLLNVLVDAASAHHSTAIYDSDNPVELSGTVVEWNFTNPHCIVRLEVIDGSGNNSIWILEGSNTSNLFRRGWTPMTLQPGDKIIVRVRPLRSGVPGGNYSDPRWEDGTPVDPRAEG